MIKNTSLKNTIKWIKKNKTVKVDMLNQYDYVSQVKQQRLSQ